MKPIRSVIKPKLWLGLWPLGYIYGGIMAIRNWLFDHGILPQEHFPVPIISVGNLAVGGTGKTPHTEALATHLSRQFAVAILSRGYGRRTKGYRSVQPTDTADLVGDEPLQMCRKSVAQTVAVCEDRRKGIRQLLSIDNPPDVILLDDGFQHRYAYRNIDILLTDFRRLYPLDKPLPTGRLREYKSGAQRAQIIIVTKCPADLTESQATEIRELLQPTDNQHVFFSTLTYPAPYLIGQPDTTLPADVADVLLFSGIANPATLQEHFGGQPYRIRTLRFADHHAYTTADLQQIQTAFDALPAGPSVAITTEKDAVRIEQLHTLSPALQERLYVQPVRVEFLFGGEVALLQILQKSIMEFSHNS